MGLMFLYFVPCFFVDVTESWVSATKIQRLGTIMAGIWVELVMCGVAMIFWLNAPPGSWVHKVAYEVILLTGIAAVVINLNPLIKLDGYYFATEIIEIPDLKERSTAFLTGWFQAKVLRLPVEVPVVPRRRALLFGIYAFVSGLYSYVLLFFVVRLSYRLGSRFMAEFALIPSGRVCLCVIPFETAIAWQSRQGDSGTEFSIQVPVAFLVYCRWDWIGCTVVCAAVAGPRRCLLRD